jgi:hypothetical protein
MTSYGGAATSAARPSAGRSPGKALINGMGFSSWSEGHKTGPSGTRGGIVSKEIRVNQERGTINVRKILPKNENKPASYPGLFT